MAKKFRALVYRAQTTHREIASGTNPSIRKFTVRLLKVGGFLQRLQFHPPSMDCDRLDVSEIIFTEAY